MTCETSRLPSLFYLNGNEFPLQIFLPHQSAYVEVGDVGKRSVPTPSIDKKDLEKENMQKKITLVTYWVEAATRLNMEHILSVY